MNEMLFRQLERMLKESRYQSSCHEYKEIEAKVLNLTNDQLYEATQMMYSKGPNGFAPHFNFPNITYAYIEKGDVDSPIFQSIKNRVIFWENFADAKPDIDAEMTYLEALVSRDTELSESEVEKIASIAKISKGSMKFEKAKDKIISSYGTPCDNTVMIEGPHGVIYSDELYKNCVEETVRFFELSEGFCLKKNMYDVASDLRFLIFKHHNFEGIMYKLVFELFATDCIYTAFLDSIVLSISNRLEQIGLEYDFIEDIIKDRFEIYGMLDMDDEFEKKLTMDIIALEKIVNIRPYPYNSIMAWLEERRTALLF